METVRLYDGRDMGFLRCRAIRPIDELLSSIDVMGLGYYGHLVLRRRVYIFLHTLRV